MNLLDPNKNLAVWSVVYISGESQYSSFDGYKLVDADECTKYMLAET